MVTCLMRAVDDHLDANQLHRGDDLGKEEAKKTTMSHLGHWLQQRRFD